MFSIRKGIQKTQLPQSFKERLEQARQDKKIDAKQETLLRVDAAKQERLDAAKQTANEKFLAAKERMEAAMALREAHKQEEEKRAPAPKEKDPTLNMRPLPSKVQHVRIPIRIYQQ